jgi:hypothetical protein
LNVPVLAGAIAVLAVFLTAAVVHVVRRRQRDVVRSVHHYHDRLDTLHVDPQDRGGAVRVVEGEAVVTSHEPVGRPRVQLDSLTIGASPDAPPPEVQRRKGRAWALSRTQPRTRIDTTTLWIVVVVLVALGALALAGYLLRSDDNSTTGSLGADHAMVTVLAPPALAPRAVGVADTALARIGAGRNLTADPIVHCEVGWSIQALGMTPLPTIATTQGVLPTSRNLRPRASCA